MECWGWSIDLPRTHTHIHTQAARAYREGSRGRGCGGCYRKASHPEMFGRRSGGKNGGREKQPRNEEDDLLRVRACRRID